MQILTTAFYTIYDGRRRRGASSAHGNLEKVLRNWIEGGGGCFATVLNSELEHLLQTTSNYGLHYFGHEIKPVVAVEAVT